MFDFIKRNKAKIMASGAVAGFTAALSSVGAFASSTATYTPKAVPQAQDMDLSTVGNVWNYAQSMLQDVIAIISNYPLLVTLVLTLPLIGIGIGLFKRIIY